MVVSQIVEICLYNNLFIQDSANISETVQTWWPTSLFCNMVIKQKKACTNLTYLDYLLDNNVCQHVGIVCLLLQSFFGPARWSCSILLAALLFYNTWKLMKCATTFFHNKLLYCSVLRNWNIYYSHFCKNLVLLIQPYHCILSRNVVTVVSVS